MGTRALIHVYEDRKDKPLITIYRQHDGYPNRLGQELADVLAPMKLVNGFSRSDIPQANGMGYAAAQIVVALKGGVGNVYLYPAGASDCWEKFVYHVRPDGETFKIKVEDSKGNYLFGCRVKDFKGACEAWDKQQHEASQARSAKAGRFVF